MPEWQTRCGKRGCRSDDRDPPLRRDPLRHLKPDFKTIADFRRDNRNAFRHVFRQFVLLCRQLDLFGRELLAVDGTRIKAVNNKDRKDR
jgi:transposase